MPPLLSSRLKVHTCFPKNPSLIKERYQITKKPSLLSDLEGRLSVSMDLIFCVRSCLRGSSAQGD